MSVLSAEHVQELFEPRPMSSTMPTRAAAAPPPASSPLAREDAAAAQKAYYMRQMQGRADHMRKPPRLDGIVLAGPIGSPGHGRRPV